MTEGTGISDKIIAAIADNPGLRPAVPIAKVGGRGWPFDSRRYAVGLTTTVVEVRVVATAVPLVPLLDTLALAIRPLLSGTPWESAELRLTVTELDAAAFTTGGDPDHFLGA